MLINVVINTPEKKFLGAPIGYLEKNCSNFITAISLARMYILLNENIEILKNIENKQFTLKDIAFEPIETPDMKNYFKYYLDSELDENPEDFEIKNELIKEKIELEGKSKEKIEQELNGFIKLKFGFDFNDLKIFSLLVREEWSERREWESFINKAKLFNRNIPKFAMFDR